MRPLNAYPPPASTMAEPFANQTELLFSSRLSHLIFDETAAFGSSSYFLVFLGYPKHICGCIAVNHLFCNCAGFFGATAPVFRVVQPLRRRRWCFGRFWSLHPWEANTTSRFATAVLCTQIPKNCRSRDDSARRLLSEWKNGEPAMRCGRRGYRKCLRQRVLLGRRGSWQAGLPALRPVSEAARS